MQRVVGMCLVTIALLAASTCAALAAGSVAYRLTDLDLRDPHIFVNFLGCRDITDTQLTGFSFNSNMQTQIQTDSEPDGMLDMSLILIFDPLDQSGTGGALRFGHSSCTAPIGSTICGPNPYESLYQMTAANGASGVCLGVLAGTTSHAYSPSIVSAGAPCFSTDPQDLTLDLGGITLTLRSARVAAKYLGSPATTLVSGLIRGFLKQVDADNTIVPNSYPLIGGQVFSALLPGGDPPGPGVSCASWSDKEFGPDGLTLGWWMYFNFTAAAVSYTGPQLGVLLGDQPAVILSATPSPFRSSVTLEYALTREGPARIAVYDVFGRSIATLASGRQLAGTHRLTWDGYGAGHTQVPAGLYAIRLSCNGKNTTRMVVRLQ